MRFLLLPGLDGTGRLFTVDGDHEVRTLPSPHLVLQCRPKESAEAVLEFLGGEG